MVVYEPALKNSRRRRRNALANIFDGFSDEDIETLRSPYSTNGDDEQGTAAAYSSGGYRSSRVDYMPVDSAEATADRDADGESLGDE